MTLDDFLLEGLDYVFMDARYMCFWITTILEAMPLLGPESDAGLERLCTILYDHCATNTLSAPLGKQVYQEVIALRGLGSSSDNSCLGLKYRCLKAIAAGLPRENSDGEDWQYCILTAFQLINYDGDKDEVLLERIKRGLRDLRT